MRLRYSAFVLKQKSYLLQTHAPETQHRDLAAHLDDTFKSTTWLSLHILQTTQGIEADNKGTVTFVAVYQNSETKQFSQIHECTQFIKADNAWQYLAGEHRLDYSFERNKPCWCGSGIKMKKCHKTWQSLKA